MYEVPQSKPILKRDKAVKIASFRSTFFFLLTKSEKFPNVMEMKEKIPNPKSAINWMENILNSNIKSLKYKAKPYITGCNLLSPDQQVLPLSGLGGI